VDQIESIDKFLSSKTFLQEALEIYYFSTVSVKYFYYRPPPRGRFSKSMEKGWVKQGNPRIGRFGEGGGGLFFSHAGLEAEKKKRSAKNSG